VVVVLVPDQGWLQQGWLRGDVVAARRASGWRKSGSRRSSSLRTAGRAGPQQLLDMETTVVEVAGQGLQLASQRRTGTLLTSTAPHVRRALASATEQAVLEAAAATICARTALALTLEEESAVVVQGLAVARVEAVRARNIVAGGAADGARRQKQARAV
jgi:hypothetical protein